MTKIFFKDRYIEILDPLYDIARKDIPLFEVYAYTNFKTLLQLFLQDDRICYQLLPTDKRSSFNAFKSHFIIDKAAGGLVFNDQNEILVIKRFGKWDLPKGHLEKGEKKKAAAIREVEEECGISQLRITRKLATTWHVHKRRNRQVLKKTSWYEMHSTYSDVLTPQIEEDITEVKWVSRDNLDEILGNTWPSLIHIFESHLK